LLFHSLEMERNFFHLQMTVILSHFFQKSLLNHSFEVLSLFIFTFGNDNNVHWIDKIWSSTAPKKVYLISSHFQIESGFSFFSTLLQSEVLFSSKDLIQFLFLIGFNVKIISEIHLFWSIKCWYIH
jgi:hypothetical protein